MQVWQVMAPGDAPQLTSQRPLTPAKGEIVVRVEAVGLNFADMLAIQGRYQVKHTFPLVPGMELAGVVERAGPDTDGPAVGTRVLATCPAGALAGWVSLPADRLFALPDRMTFAEAAGFPIAYGTSHVALAHKARLQPGETLFVTGAAGGVGLTAVEIGKRLGARVIASARGPHRLATARDAGADVLIDSDAPDLRSALRAEGGIDVVIDTVGGPAFDSALRSCRPDGRLLTIGFASGEVPQIAANLLLVKNLTVTGFWFGGYESHAPDIVRDSLRQLLQWYESGLVRPHVSHILPFDAFPEGLALLRDRKATGKVVVLVGHAP